jgi:hypothetical protein
LSELEQDDVRGPLTDLSIIAFLSLPQTLPQIFSSLPNIILLLNSLVLLDTSSNPAMALSAPNSTLPRPQTHLTPPSALSSFAIDGAKFSFYLLALQTFSPSSSWPRPAPHVIRKKYHCLFSLSRRKISSFTDNDTEYALNDRDMEAAAILR